MFRTAGFVSRLNFRINGCHISPASRVGAGFYIPHPKQIVFEGIAGNNLTLYSSCIVVRDTQSGAGGKIEGYSPFPVIGHNVLIGADALVVGGVTVGDNSVIGALTVLRSDVSPDGIVITPSKSTYQLKTPERTS